MNILTQPGCEVERPAKAHSKNLLTIIKAAKNNDLGLIECRFKATGERVAVLCAFALDPKTEEIVYTPFAVLLNGNPYEMLEPPDPADSHGFLKD